MLVTQDFETADFKETILKCGFVCIKAAKFGRLADAFAAKGYPCQTEDGIDFLIDIFESEVSNPN